MSSQNNKRIKRRKKSRLKEAFFYPRLRRSINWRANNNYQKINNPLK
jgi:hypothetical protein